MKTKMVAIRLLYVLSIQFIEFSYSVTLSLSLRVPPLSRASAVFMFGSKIFFTSWRFILAETVLEVLFINVVTKLLWI